MPTDNVTSGVPGAVFRALADAGSVEWPAAVCCYATAVAPGANTLQPVDATHGLPVAVVGSVPVTDGGGSLTVDGAVAVSNFPATQAVAAAQLPAALTGAGNLPVALAELAGPVPVTDNGGSLTVDGSVSVSNFPATQAVTQSGVWTVTANAGTGTFGTNLAQYGGSAVGATNAVHVQPGTGATFAVTGTFWQATQPVSGTVAATQSGTWNLGTVTTLTGITNVVHVDDNGGSLTVDGAVTANIGTSGSLALDATLTGGTQKAIPVAGTTGGATPYQLISAASTNATSVKGSAGTLYSCVVFNTNAAARYLKLYDKATAPSVGSDTPKQTYTIPGATTGAGFVVPLPVGLDFPTGIALALTTGVAVADTGAVAANEIVVNLGYK